MMTIPDSTRGFPIIVGISGHRLIDPEGASSVRSSLLDALKRLQDRLDGNLYVATGLAEGADQLAAEVAGELKIAHIAVLPMRLADFEATLSTDDAKASLHRHWQASALRVELPPIPAEPGDTAADADKLQYEQLGAVLSRFSHLLIAMWDGVVWPRDDVAARQARRGGTAHVIEMHSQGERMAMGFRRSPLFRGASSHLDMASGGPVLHIMAPRSGEGSPPRPAGSWSLLDAPALSDRASIINELLGDARDEKTASATSQFFKEILHLNERERCFNEHYLAILKRQMSYLRIDRAADTDPYLDFLRRRQAAADTAAQFYQHKLLGDAPTTVSVVQRMRHWADSLFRQRRVARLGVVFGYAFWLMVSVICFELFAHVFLEAAWLLVIQLGILWGAYGFHSGLVKERKWQNRFQDYRAVAEAMRVQVFWALGGIPSAVSDQYMRKQRDEMSWISFALRGPALWSIAVALKQAGKPQRDLIEKAWLCDQRDYFSGPDGATGKAMQNHHAHKRNQRLRNVLVGVAFFLTFVLITPLLLQLWQFVSGAPLHSLESWNEWLKFEHVHGSFVTAIVLLLALGATVHLVSEKFAFEAHALAYSAMGKLFAQAIDVAQGRECSTDDAAYQTLLRELGREALAENSDWLEDHRRREVAPEQPG
ncbi:hypothetical protein [Roseateles sp. P5_D6]